MGLHEQAWVNRNFSNSNGQVDLGRLLDHYQNGGKTFGDPNINTRQTSALQDLRERSFSAYQQQKKQYYESQLKQTTDPYLRDAIQTKIKDVSSSGQSAQLRRLDLPSSSGSSSTSTARSRTNTPTLELERPRANPTVNPKTGGGTVRGGAIQAAAGVVADAAFNSPFVQGAIDSAAHWANSRLREALGKQPLSREEFNRGLNEAKNERPGGSGGSSTAGGGSSGSNSPGGGFPGGGSPGGGSPGGSSPGGGPGADPNAPYNPIDPNNPNSPSRPFPPVPPGMPNPPGGNPNGGGVPDGLQPPSPGSPGNALPGGGSDGGYTFDFPPIAQPASFTVSSLIVYDEYAFGIYPWDPALGYYFRREVVVPQTYPYFGIPIQLFYRRRLTGGSENGFENYSLDIRLIYKRGDGVVVVEDSAGGVSSLGARGRLKSLSSLIRLPNRPPISVNPNPGSPTPSLPPDYSPPPFEDGTPPVLTPPPFNDPFLPTYQPDLSNQPPQVNQNNPNNPNNPQFNRNNSGGSGNPSNPPFADPPQWMMPFANPTSGNNRNSNTGNPTTTNAGSFPPLEPQTPQQQQQIVDPNPIVEDNGTMIKRQDGWWYPKVNTPTPNQGQTMQDITDEVRRAIEENSPIQFDNPNLRDITDLSRLPELREQLRQREEEQIANIPNTGVNPVTRNPVDDQGNLRDTKTPEIQEGTRNKSPEPRVDTKPPNLCQDPCIADIQNSLKNNNNNNKQNENKEELTRIKVKVFKACKADVEGEAEFDQPEFQVRKVDAPHIKMLYDRLFELEKEKCKSKFEIPETMALRAPDGRPVLKITYRERSSSGKIKDSKWVVQLPHYTGGKQGVPKVAYKHGSTQVRYHFPDGSRIVINAASESEGKRVIRALLNRVDGSKRKGGKYYVSKSTTEDGKDNGMKSVQLVPTSARFYSRGDGIRNGEKAQPDWTESLK